MEKIFSNSLNQQLIFTDEGINFVDRKTFFPYEKINSISLGLIGVFTVSGPDGFETFTSDGEDRAELKEMIKFAKEKIASKSNTESVSAEDIKKLSSSIKYDFLTVLITFGVVMAIAGIFFLMMPVIPVLLIYLIIALLAFLFILGPIKLSFKREVPPELKNKKKLFNLFIVLLVAIYVAVSAFLTYACYNKHKTGYKRGNYSSHKCDDCGAPADGGMWDDKNPDLDSYYCKEHYEEHWEYYKKHKSEFSVKDKYGNDKYSAFSAAERAVKSQLKSPSSAEFCSVSEASISRDGNTWTVSGYVDAENSFGASLRSQFSVEITYTGKGEYTINSCIVS